MTAKSAFFRACLENKCKESTDNIIKVEEDDPIAVQSFLGWLYSGKVDDRAADIDSWGLVESYVFAEKILCDEYHNQVMDKIKESHKGKVAFVASHFVEKLYSRGLCYTQFAAFGLQCMAYNLMTRPKNFVEAPSAKRHLKRWMEHHEMCKDLTKETLNFRIIPYTDPLDSKDCKWHQHGDGQNCGS